MENSRWKEFEIRVEAYRYYLNIALQTNVFFYAITGAALGFYLKEENKPYLVYVLLMPILIAGVLGSIFLYAASLQEKAARSIEHLIKEFREVENVNIKAIPDLELLYILLKIFGWIFFAVGLALIAAAFLKEAPFQMWKIPNSLLLFGIFGILVLVFAGRITYSFAFYQDEKAERQREKTKSHYPSAVPNPVGYNVDTAIKHIKANADTKGFGYGKSIENTRKAIEAGGITLNRAAKAKDYGEKLIKAGFKTPPEKEAVLAGDIVIIEGIPGNQFGHMAMYDGRTWYSDFKQSALYPGPEYRKHKPKYKYYRFYSELTAKKK
jgi:hypothetical protein